MLTRTTLGLLFRDQFDRADGALGNGWTTEGAGAWSIDGGKAKYITADAIEGQARAPIANRSRVVVQYRCWKSQATGPGLGALAKWRASDSKGVLSWINNNGVHIFRRDGPATHAFLSSFAGEFEAQTWKTVKLLAADNLQRQWVGGVLRNSAADATLNGVLGGAGLRGNADPGYAGMVDYFDDFIVCADNTVVVTGLPVNYKIRVGTLVAPVAAGTATLDLAGTVLPAVLLEVLDGANAVVDSFAGEVWGGDTFTYASTAPPAKPTCFVQNVATSTATLLSSAFSDPDPGDTHAASRWQVDRQTGDFSAPLFDSGEDAAHLLAIEVVALPQATPLQARVAHKDAGGAWSPWSDPMLFTTRGVPEKPTLSAGVIGPFSAQVLGSAFADPDGDPHLASQWQLDDAGGDFSSPLQDSGAVAGAGLLAYTFTGLARVTPYIARGRYQDADGWSPWSDALAIATVDTWHPCGVRPATDWDPCQRVTPAVKPWARYRLDELEVTDIPYDASGNERHGAGYHASLVQLGAPGYDGGRAVLLPGTLQLSEPAIDLRNVLTCGVGGWQDGFEDTPPAIYALSRWLGGKGFSVEFWFYAEEETALPTGYWDDYGSRVIWFAQHGGAIESTRSYFAGLGFIAGTNGFVCYGHAGGYVFNGTVLAANLGPGWHRVVVITAPDTDPSMNRALCSKVFIDGFYGQDHPAKVSYYEVDWANTYAGSYIGSTNKHIVFLHGFVGSNNPGLKGASFKGRIDDIRIYDHAIDPSAPRGIWEPCGPRPTTAWTRGC